MTNPDLFVLPYVIEARLHVEPNYPLEYWGIESPTKNPYDSSKYDYVHGSGEFGILNCIEACKIAQQRLFNETYQVCPIIIKYGKETIDYDASDDDQTLELILRFS
jgi:hypothetical protein